MQKSVYVLVTLVGLTAKILSAGDNPSQDLKAVFTYKIVSQKLFQDAQDAKAREEQAAVESIRKACALAGRSCLCNDTKETVYADPVTWGNFE